MPRKASKRKPVWKAHYDATHRWPIPVGKVGKLSAPIWVWGDLGLANKLVVFLNREKP